MAKLNAPKFLRQHYAAMATAELVAEKNRLTTIEHDNRAEYGGNKTVRKMALRNVNIIDAVLAKRGN